MGYDVHITRRQDRSEGKPQITVAEWVAYCQSDPSMRLEGYAEVIAPDGKILRYEKEGLAVWIGQSQQRSSAWFDFRNGDVAVKNPDREVLKKMWLIAQALGAKVQGDEGEIYGEQGSVIER